MNKSLVERDLTKDKMFLEWCHELFKKKKNVVEEFILLIKWNGYSVRDIERIQKEIKFIQRKVRTWTLKLNVK